MALGVPGRLRPRIFSTFGTTRVVGRQRNASAAFTPGEIPGTHFQRLSRPQGTWFCRKKPWKKSPVTPPGIDPGTVRFWTVAKHFCYITFVNRVIRLTVLSYLRFEAIRHKFYRKYPVKKPLVTRRKGLLQRSLSL